MLNKTSSTLVEKVFLGSQMKLKDSSIKFDCSLTQIKRSAFFLNQNLTSTTKNDNKIKLLKKTFKAFALRAIFHEIYFGLKISGTIIKTCNTPVCLGTVWQS